MTPEVRESGRGINIILDDDPPLEPEVGAVRHEHGDEPAVPGEVGEAGPSRLVRGRLGIADREDVQRRRDEAATNGPC